MTKVPIWSQNLTQRLLAEAPENMAFWEIMASAIAGERVRCVAIVEDEYSECDELSDYGVGYRAACENISAAIKQGES